MMKTNKPKKILGNPLCINRRLIKGSINYFRGPAEASVDAVSSYSLLFVSNGLYSIQLLCKLISVCILCVHYLGTTLQVHFVLKELVRKSIA
ncbi:hypothetical protein HanXRQr2_Chr05g0196391 [Helianthus annuus]|uniref:Uncharacterized protein n=1 Tax=Helianthus annuus TaxID=4232 RepID=A0A251ULF1_HELAN|nr:hypothetical protein HanXRQr2_Chr05g0196391 [Helianthus annuus]